MRCELVTSQEQNSDQQKDLTQTKDQLESISSELAAVQTSLRSLREEHDQGTEASRKLELEIESRERDLSEQSIRLEDHVRRLAEQTQTLEEQEVTLAKQANETVEREDELRRARSDLEAVQPALEDAKKRIADAEWFHGEEKTRSEERLRRIEELEKRLDESSDLTEVKTLQAKHVQEVKELGESHEAAILKLRNDLISKQDEQAKGMQEILNAKDSELDNLRDQASTQGVALNQERENLAAAKKSATDELETAVREHAKQLADLESLHLAQREVDVETSNMTAQRFQSEVAQLKSELLELKETHLSSTETLEGLELAAEQAKATADQESIAREQEIRQLQSKLEDTETANIHQLEALRKAHLEELSELQKAEQAARAEREVEMIAARAAEEDLKAEHLAQLNAHETLSKNISLEADVGQKRLLEVEERMSSLEKQLLGKDAELADAKEVSIVSPASHFATPQLTESDLGITNEQRHIYADSRSDTK